MATQATILTGMGVALVRALAGQTLYIAVGSGLAEWDALATLPQPANTRTGLYNEVARQIATVTFLDEAGAITATPTHRIECTATFSLGIANGTLREMALVAYGSGTLGSGLYLEARHFAARIKPAGGGDYALGRTLRYVCLGVV